MIELVAGYMIGKWMNDVSDKLDQIAPANTPEPKPALDPQYVATMTNLALTRYLSTRLGRKFKNSDEGLGCLLTNIEQLKKDIEEKQFFCHSSERDTQYLAHYQEILDGVQQVVAEIAEHGVSHTASVFYS